MTPIFFALISFFGWGVGDIIGTIVTRKIGGYSTSLWFYTLSTIIFGFYAPFALNDLKNLNIFLFIFCAVLGIIGIVPLVAFYEALKKGNASVIGTISSSFTALVVIFSIIFLNERINLHQTLSIVTIFIGIVLSSLNFSKINNFRLMDKNILGAFLAMFFWGVFFTALKIPVKQIGWFWPLYISNFSGLIVLILYIKIKKISFLTKPDTNIFLKLTAATLLLYLGDFAFNIGISKGLSSIVAPISGAYPILFVILAFWFFKDPISKQQMLGIMTTLTGIVLLSFFSA